MLSNATARLISVSMERDSLGNFIEATHERTVYANRFYVGDSTWMAAKSAGLHADAEIQVRSSSYKGEQRVILDGIEFEVERVDDRGEYARLTLSKRLNND